MLRRLLKTGNLFLVSSKISLLKDLAGTFWMEVGDPIYEMTRARGAAMAKLSKSGGSAAVIKQLT
jgi:hypothetical protein